MLKIARKTVAAIVAHAKKDLPLEACGYLAEKKGLTCEHIEMTNVDQSEEHYALDPKEQFAAMKSIRKRHLKISAVYHSHPLTPARPSQEDIRLAYDPTISHVIVSLADSPETVKSFKIENGRVETENIEVIDSALKS